MHLISLLAGLSLLIPDVLSGPHQNGIIHATLKPGQKGNADFNNTFGTLFSPAAIFYPCLFPESAGEPQIFQWKPSKAANASTHSLHTLSYTFSKQSFFFTMNFGGVEFATWQEVSAGLAKDLPQVVKNGAEYDRFYLNGTKLLWDNDKPKELFESWMVCNYYYGYPQLLFTVKNAQQPTSNYGQPSLKEIPSSCALVDIDLIPVP